MNMPRDDDLVAADKSRTGELYRFEVPTPAGHIVVIAPEDMTPEEATRAGRIIAEVLHISATE